MVVDHYVYEIKKCSYIMDLPISPFFVIGYIPGVFTWKIELANFWSTWFQASKTERQKNSPTYKDLDFMELHPEGLFLEADTYQALVKTIQRDCRVGNDYLFIYRW